MSKKLSEFVYSPAHFPANKLFLPFFPGRVWAAQSKEWKTKGEVSKTPIPEFEDTETHIFVPTGRTASLPCKVKNIGDRLVRICIIF